MAMRILSKGEVKFSEKIREYDVVDRDLSPAPRYFISYNSGRPFVSDEVPRVYREPMVVHELTEFESLQNEGENRCLRALEAELKLIPRNEIKNYLNFRQKVFRELVEFLERHESSSELILRVRKSLDYLVKNK